MDCGSYWQTVMLVLFHRFLPFFNCIINKDGKKGQRFSAISMLAQTFDQTWKIDIFCEQSLTISISWQTQRLADKTAAEKK